MIKAIRPAHVARPLRSPSFSPPRFFTPLLPPAPKARSQGSLQSPLPPAILIVGALIGLHFSVEATKQALREERKKKGKMLVMPGMMLAGEGKAAFVHAAAKDCGTCEADERLV